MLVDGVLHAVGNDIGNVFLWDEVWAQAGALDWMVVRWKWFHG